MTKRFFFISFPLEIALFPADCPGKAIRSSNIKTSKPFIKWTNLLDKIQIHAKLKEEMKREYSWVSIFPAFTIPYEKKSFVPFFLFLFP